MNKLRNIHKNLLLLGIFMLLSVSMFAQPETFNRANILFREKNTELAKQTIDSVIVHPETMSDPSAWTLRAFIYFDQYKRTDKFKLYSPLRDSVIKSVKKSMSLHPDEDQTGNNKKMLLNLGAGYHNLAKTLLQDSISEERATYAYNMYKELTLLGDSAANFTAKDIEFYLTMGSIYSELFTKDNKDLKSQNIAKVALLKVLEVQPENPSANINLGLMYYNQAVNLTKEMAYDIPLDQIDFVQENIVKLAKQSEQFISRVYNNDNKNQKSIEALYYIYRMLNENARSDEFKKIGEPLGIKFNVEEKVDQNGQPIKEEGGSKDEKPKEEGKPVEGKKTEENPK